MQYACGYVPYKLLKRYGKRKGTKAEQFTKCLQSMAVADDDSDADDLLSYTRVWLEKENRGGLFLLSDKTFQFFVAVEEVRTLLLKHISKNDPSKDVKCVVEDILKNEDVQFFGL